jgi:Rrf2 family protein
MLSQTVEYALRVVVFLASRRGEPAVTRQIAQATQVPEGYLSKVLQGLSRAGLVRSQRGLHGGSVLGVLPEKLTVYDVIQSVDPIKRITTCPLAISSHGTNLCPLHRRLDNAMGLVEAAFRKTSISDLLAEAGASTPLCENPNAEALNTPGGIRAAQRLAFPVEKPATLTISRGKAAAPAAKRKRKAASAK